jgi:Asp-tRNA(Asn)/Glu-tRNA(Gln) amidotransferase A subunit family amidase
MGKLNPVLNAFITITADSALARAQQSDEEILRGAWRGPLHGIPMALKDLIDTAGIPTTAASLLYKYRVPIESAPLVRYLEDAGAVLLGKQNLHEFAYGGSSIISAFGEVHNPWNPAHIAGGSSGGSAAATACGLGYAAIGTDTAGSIREPAALSGVVGLKPTYGCVKAAGVIPLSKSLDHVGPITPSVLDAALVLQTLSPTTAPGAITGQADLVVEAQKDPGALRVGIARAFFCDDLDPEVQAAFEQAVRDILRLVSDVREITLTPDSDRTVSNLESYRVHQQAIQNSANLYQPETLRRIRNGEAILQADYDRAVVKLRESREGIAAVLAKANVDVILTPTTPVPAPTITELREQPETLRARELVLLRNTRPFNVWGIPAISVPCGFTSKGLPIGLQIAAGPWRDHLVLRLANAYEQATDWHTRRPAISSA